MRIIGGRLKGHKLVSFQADNIRPTTDRVKESLFNILQAHWDGARVLDLFSGTGNLAFEAISRGASHVLAVENHRKSLEIILKNKNHLKIAEGFELKKQDVFQFLKSFDGKTFDVVLIDPPFDQALAHEVMSAVASSKIFGPQSIIAIESRRQEKLEDRYLGLARIDTRNFGDKLLSLFTERLPLEDS